MPATYGTETFTGGGQVSLVSIAPSHDPARGSSWVWLYQGTRSGIETLAANLRLQQVRFQASQADGTFTLQAWFGSDPENPALESPVDVYERGNELSQGSVFENPLLWNWLVRGNNPGEAKKFMLDVVEAGTSSSFSDSAADATYLSLCRGVDSYWILKPTFRRTREFSLAYSDQRVPTTTPTAYTRAGLITAFNIPSVIAAKLLPPDPTGVIPADTQWLWRVSTDESETLGSASRIREVIQWTADFHYPALLQVLA